MAVTLLRNLPPAGLVVVALIVGSNSFAASVTLLASKDNSLYESPTGALSNGAGEFLFAGRTGATGGGQLRRGLLAFDIGSLVPPDFLITAVTLTLHLSNRSALASGSQISLFRVSADWGEGISDAMFTEGKGAPVETGDATWLHRFAPSELWSTPGGDFATPASASTTVTTLNTFYSWSTSGMVGDVQNWLSSPAANFGWMLRGDESRINTGVRFDSRSNSVSANRPRLVVEYQPVPEPAAIGLLAVSVIFAVSRMRSSLVRACRPSRSPYSYKRAPCVATTKKAIRHFARSPFEGKDCLSSTSACEQAKA